MIEILETRIAPANILWTGSTDSLWSHSGNWVDAATFSAATIAPGDTLYFDDAGAFNTLINDTVPGTSYTLVFTTTSHPYALVGNSITLPNGGGVGAYGSSPVTIGLSLSGPGAVLQTGGLLTLDAANTFSGGVVVSGGGFRISAAASLGTGDVTLTGGVFEPLASFAISNNFHLGTATFSISTGTTATLSGTISDTTTPGSLSKTGAGTLVLANSGNTFTGNIGINSGILRVTASATTVNPVASALGDPQNVRTIFVGAGSILEFAASNVFGIDGSTPNVVLALQGTATNTVGKFNTLGPVHLGVTGLLTGLGGLSSTKQMYSLKGDVTSDGGVISGTGGNAGYHIGAGISFGTNAAPLTINAMLLDQTAGLASVPTPLVIEGSGTVMLTKANRFSGGVFVESGKLSIATNSNLGALTNGINIRDEASLTARATITTARAVTLSGFATIDVGPAAILTLTGSVSNGVGLAPGHLNVTGPGKLVLSNSNNSFSGGTSIDGGKVRISMDENLGASAGDVTMLNGGKLEVTTNLTTPRDFTIGGIARFGVPGGKVLTISGIVQDATIPGEISVSGGGTIVLSNPANTFTGPYTISGGFLTLAGVTTRISGPGSATIVPLGSGGIESIVLTGTTLTSRLALTSSTEQGAPTLPVYRISIPSATDHINSIDLRRGKLLFGDGNVDTDADLFIAGKSKSLSFQDVNTGAILKLGAGLPYNVVGDETTPDTYNNKPNIMIRDILGEDARIDVTGDRTEGGIGGGGLGKVRIHSWRPPANGGGGTGPVPSPNLGATEPPAYGIIETTQTIDLIEIQDGDADIDVFADAEGVGAGTVANVLEIKCTTGDWKSKSSKIEGKLGKFTVKEFSGTIDVGGDVGEDDGFTIKSFTVTGKFSGELKAGAIISIKAGNFTGTALKKARITATTTNIGDISTTNGNMDYTIVQSIGNIGNISLAGSGLGKLKNSMILSGTYLGDDGIVGGDIDTFAGGTTIGNITLVGDMTASVIAASISPNAGGFDGPFVIGNVDTSYLAGGSIGTVKLLSTAIATSAVTSSGSYTNLIMAKTIADIIENKSGGISKLASAGELSATGTARLFTTNSLLVASVL